MYQAYWGFAESPFAGQLDVSRFFQAPPQEEALARLHFLVDEHRTLGLLLGDSGSGKTLVLNVFVRPLRRLPGRSALVNVAGQSEQEFLWLLAAQLGVDVPYGATEFRLARAIDDFFAASAYEQLSTVVLLDDADEARPEVIDQIIRLVQYGSMRDPRLTVVLAAQPRRVARLGERLLGLSELRIDLANWEFEDTAAYVKQALARAGRSTPIFAPGALRRLHELSGGVPRRVRQLADLALVAGAGANAPQIEGDIIDSVFEELALAAPATAKAH